MRKISIIHPSRGRLEQAYNTFRAWTELADNLSNIEYILSVEIAEAHAYSQRFINFLGIVDILGMDNRTAIKAINNAAKYAAGNIFIVISDDFQAFEGWDTALLKAIEGKHQFCAKTNDGLQKTLITLPIMDRAYYNIFEYIYYPGYQHMFCDQEMTAVAIMTGHFIELPLTFLHNHYTTGKNPKDVINIKNDSTWKQGETLFNERLQTNFGIKNPVSPYIDIAWK